MIVMASAMLRLAGGGTPVSAVRYAVLVGFFVTVPAVLTIAEIFANPHPIRIRDLFRWWRDSRLDVVNLR